MDKIIIIALLFVLSTIATGVYYMYKGTSADEKKLRMFLKFNMVFFLPLMFMTVFTLVPGFVSAQTEGGSSQGLGFIAAGLSTGLASLGAGVAVANVGSSAISTESSPLILTIPMPASPVAVDIAAIVSFIFHLKYIIHHGDKF